MGTQDKLIEDLMRKPRNSLRDQLIAQAAQGRYHDFKSDHPTPKVLLVEDLRRYGYRDIASAAMNGAYDEHMDDEDRAAMKQQLKENPRLAEIWAKMKDEPDFEKALKIATSDLTEEEIAAARAQILNLGRR